MDDVARSGAVYCHAYDQPEVCAGAGTLGLELLDQLEAVGREVDTVLVAVGGGGSWPAWQRRSRAGPAVVAVEPARAATLHDALAAGGPVEVSVSGVAADSLGARRIGDIAWDVVQRVGVTSVLVDDEAMVGARQQLSDRYRLVVEVGAAAPVAA